MCDILYMIFPTASDLMGLITCLNNSLRLLLKQTKS